MSEIQEYAHILKNWEKQQNTKTISDVLKRIQNLTALETEQDVSHIIDSLTIFNKSANKAEPSKVDEKWFKDVVESKKHAKSLLEKIQKAKIKTPKIVKNPQIYQYPNQLLLNKTQRFCGLMKNLYKSFLTNADEQIFDRKHKIVDFLNQIINEISKQFDIKINEEKDFFYQQKFSKVKRRVESINQQLSKERTLQAKKQMLKQQIDYKRVARNQPEAYEGKQLAKIRQNKLLEFIKQNETRFYDKMRRNINKDANQKCRFCHKNTAYCEGMKQIRASDEPMTKFMVCNSCGNRWRQQ